MTESFETKAKVLASLSPASPGNTIVASNTSSIPIARLAAVYDKHVPNGASNFIGMHFMNPVPQMRLVELIAGRGTSEATFATTKGLAEMMGKTTTRSADVPGFIANRILMPYINEAIFALHEVSTQRLFADRVLEQGRTLTRRWSSARESRWARLPWQTSSASIFASRSCRSCTPSWVTQSTARVRCSSSTLMQAGSVTARATAIT